MQSNRMDMGKFIREKGLSAFPVGLGGCRTDNRHFDSCDYDLFVFDEEPMPPQIHPYDGGFVTVHHSSLSETSSERLLQYHRLEILQDESWDLQMMLSRIDEKQDHLFSDYAKNSLIESQFCSQKTVNAIRAEDVFAPCWQKAAIHHLAKSISAINHIHFSPSHVLDSLRRLKKNTVNEHISNVTETVGIERATPVLLERMLKSTIGFSDTVEEGGRSEIIAKKYDYFLGNSMLADCYFYLGCINHENFIRIKDTVSRRPELFHILKIGFDIEADTNLLEQQAETIRRSCNEILRIISGI